VPTPDFSLPKVALDNILEHVPEWVIEEKMPDFLQEVLQSQYHYATTEADTLTGRAGVVDFFVFDTELANTDPKAQDTIIGFEVGVDVIVYSNFSEREDRSLGTEFLKDDDRFPDARLGFQDSTLKEVSTNLILIEDLPIAKLPEGVIQPILLAGAFQGHAVHEADVTANRFAGTKGVIDYFVFDMAQLNDKEAGSRDWITGFESGIDKVVIENFEAGVDRIDYGGSSIRLFDRETGISQAVEFTDGFLPKDSVITVPGEFLV
jgi:hypothetical protein